MFFKFNLFQILSLVFLFYFFNFDREKKAPHFSWVFFISTFLVILVGLLNPNNNLTIGQYFYEGNLLNFYYLLIISAVILYIEYETYLVLFNRIFTIGFYVLLTRAILSLLMYFSGHGMQFNGGAASTIPQMDTLIFLSAFQVLSVAMFLNTKDKKYLVFVLIFIATLFFSYRRSALGLGIIADIILLFYYFLATPHKTQAIKMFMIFLGSLLILIFSFKMAMPAKFNDLFNRFAGAFSFFSDKSSIPIEYSDSGHMEQSIRTTQEFFNRAGNTFWGGGFGNPPFFVEGQTEVDDSNTVGYIHNSFVQSWSQWGLHVTLYLVVLVLLFFRLILHLLANKTLNFVIPGIIIFLFCFLLLGWSNGILFVEHLQYIVVFSLLFSVIKFLPQRNNSLL